MISVFKSFSKKKIVFPWKAAVLLAGLTFLLYLRAMHGQFIWDDDDYVTQNLTLRTLSGLGEIWFQIGRLSQYYPLTYTSFWLNYHLWGLNPAGYHLVNVLLHAVNGILVWRLLDHLKLKHAWFIGLLFAFHPVHVESVAWITERKNLLSGLFYLTSLLFYLRGGFILSYFLFLGALTSKTVTATLPATILLILWWRDGKFSRKDLLRLVPFFLTAAVFSPITVALENHHILLTGIDEWSFPPAERFLMAGRAVWFYVIKLICPYPLVFIYPRWQIHAHELWQWLYPVSFFLLALFFWNFRKSLDRGPFAALAIFTITIFPVLGFKNFFPMRYSFVADHFQYLASIPLLALFVSLASDILKNERMQKRAACLLLLGMGFLTWNRQAAFVSQETLWRDTLHKNPGAWMAHNNLGAILLQKKMGKEALTQFEEAIRLKPDNAEAINNLGQLKQSEGKTQEAIPYFEKAIGLEPNHALFELNLGTALFGLGKTDDAVLHYRKAIELDPRFGAVYFSLGNTFLQKKKIKEADDEFQKAVRFSPDFADGYTSLGYTRSRLGKIDEGIANYRKAIALDPNQADAHNNLANALSAQGLFDEAETHYKIAMKLDPASTLIQKNFAVLLARRAEQEKAGRT